jgi:RHS repeat-associated protein
MTTSTTLATSLEGLEGNIFPEESVPGVSVSTFDYDYIGRRVRKGVHFLGGSGSDYVMTYVYSGWNKIQETKTVGSTVTVKNFVWGLDLSQSMEGAGGIGGLVATVMPVDGVAVSLLHTYDGNGNTSELLDSPGNVLAHYEYDAFGNTVLSSGSLASENCYRFSTKEADDESGLYYYGFRFYDPSIGRWTQRDPAGERMGLHLYAFVRNGANYKVDVLGRQEFIPLCFGDNCYSQLADAATKIGKGRYRPETRDDNRGRGQSYDGIFDERGQELLDHWLEGTGTPIVTFNVLTRKLPDGDARGLRDGHFGVTRAQSVMAIGTCA